MTIVPVILAGGTGSRLWPLSRKSMPKQFLKLSTSGYSMLQDTVLRAAALSQIPPIIICSDEHRFMVAEQLREINQNEAKILLEPFGRNTAPAIAIACWLVQSIYTTDVSLVVLAADHLISDVDNFATEISRGVELAQHEYMVAFGVIPEHPETGYGYIKLGAPTKFLIGNLIDKFVEKPSPELAKQYVASDQYLWNSGMFAFKVSTYLNELEKYAPQVYKATQAASTALQDDIDFIRIPTDNFIDSPDISIDYAIMEKTLHAAVVPLSSSWNDLGSWQSLWKTESKDKNGNVHVGDVYLYDSSNSYAHSSSKLVCLIGVKNLVVVETKDAILVSEQSQSQKVKDVVKHLAKENRDEHIHHTKVYRPWGTYETVDKGPRYQVKRITVKPKAKLSVQMHHHRAEHWIVVSGAAKVYNGENSYLVTENESTYIPIGRIHALENPGVIPLELIEVQSGAYLGEDDIIRFDDLYGRA